MQKHSRAGKLWIYKEPLAKVWVDELQSRFECDFELK